MGKSENHVYNIDLEINNSQSSKAALKYMQDAFVASEGSIDALNKAYDELASKTEDTTELQKQYNKVIEKTLKDRDSMIDKLNAEKIALLKNTDLTDEQRETQLRIIDAKIKNIKLEKQMTIAKTNEFKVEKKLSGLIKDDLHALKDKVKEQFKFIAALKTTEGRYNAIKKAAEGVAKAGLKIGKGAAIGAGGLLIGTTGMVLGAAEQLAEKDRALQSLKGNIDSDVVDKVQISTGADYSTIIAAINRISDLKPKSTDQLITGAIEEVLNPGMGRMLMIQTQIDNQSIEKMVAANAQIRKQTGAQDLTEAYSATERIRAVSNGTIGQIPAVQAYSALTQGGLSDESAIKIINAIAKQKGNFIENLNNADLSKYVRGTEKNIARNLQLGLSKIDTSKQPTKTKAQELAEKMREFELKKNELLTKLLPLLEPLLKELDEILKGPTVEKIVKGLLNFFKEAVPILVNILTKLEPHVNKLINWIANLVGSNAQNSNTLGAVVVEDASKIFSTLLRGVGEIFNFELPRKKNLPGGQKAQGGLVTAPSICGEAGPELVIPLDNSRAGRASQIINNYNTTQSFNMQSNQSTPLAFSQAIGQNRFIKRFVGV